MPIRISSFIRGSNDKLLSAGFLLLRLTAGGILFVAGSGKVFGWFGGYGLELTIKMFVSHMGISAFWATVSSLTEMIGGVLFIIGFLTRPAAFAVTINMAVAAYVSLPRGFLAGAAYPFTIMIISLVLLIAGPMLLSIDAILFRSSAARDPIPPGSGQ